MIVRKVPHREYWGTAFAKIRRNPDTDGQKTNPCLTSGFKNVMNNSESRSLYCHFWRSESRRDWVWPPGSGVDFKNFRNSLDFFGSFFIKKKRTERNELNMENLFGAMNSMLLNRWIFRSWVMIADNHFFPLMELTNISWSFTAMWREMIRICCRRKFNRTTMSQACKTFLFLRLDFLLACFDSLHCKIRYWPIWNAIFLLILEVSMETHFFLRWNATRLI